MENFVFIEFAARSFGYLFRICGVSFALCLVIFFFLRANGFKLRVWFEKPKVEYAAEGSPTYDVQDYHAKEKK